VLVSLSCTHFFYLIKTKKMPSQTKQAHCKRCVFILYQTKNHRLPPRLFYRAKAKITSVKNRKDQKKKGEKKR
jgi:hypothetical protein